MPVRARATVPPVPLRSLPAASLRRTVIVLVAEPSATIDVGEAAIVLVSVDALPAVIDVAGVAGGEAGRLRVEVDLAGGAVDDDPRRDAVRRGRIRESRHGARAAGLGEGDDGRVVGGDGVAGRVLNRRRERVVVTRRVRARVREGDLACGAVDDGEGAEGAGGEPGGGGLHGDGADELAGDRLGGDAGGGGCSSGAGDGAGTGLLGEGEDGRVVGGDGVAGRVLKRRGQHAGGAGDEVGGRAGEGDLACGAVDDGEGRQGCRW